MKKALQNKQNELYHFVGGKKVTGQNNNMSGDCSGLRGNCSDLYGNIGDCKITEEERKKGVNIKDLIV